MKQFLSILFLSPLFVHATEFICTNQTELNTALSTYIRGDTITITGTNVTFKTATPAAATYGGLLVRDNRIGVSGDTCILTASTAGNVIFTDSSQLVINGQFVKVTGIYWNAGNLGTRNGQGSGGLVTGTGSRNLRITNCKINNYNSTIDDNYKFITLQGKYWRTDHCTFSNKTTDGPLMNIVVSDSMAGQVDSCEFLTIAAGVGEAIRNGVGVTASGTTQDINTYNVFYDNYFSACNGDNEIFSDKSSYNIWRHNTFYQCVGGMSLRQANNCLVERNFVFGTGIAETKGITVYGLNHIIRNNYFDGIEGLNRYANFSFPNGQIDNETDCFSPTSFPEARNILFDSNVIVNVAMPISYGYNFGATERNQIPRGVYYTANIWLNSDSALVKNFNAPYFTQFNNNYAWNVTAATISGITVINPVMTADGFGVFRITGGSPAGVTALNHNLWVGSNTAPLNPIQQADVGPDW